ncbi:MAG: hypothetical protein IT374_22060 [Polyangiaceae bacterium]|nr:hypothetical protein [Polyangiaceae bacterium]
MNRTIAPTSLVAALLLSGCSGSEPPPPAPPPAPPAAPASSVAAAPPPPAAPEPPPPPPLPAVELVEGTPAAAPDKAPTIALRAPARDQVISRDKAGDFEVKIDLKGWDVPAGGNHVHLILDGRPYKRIDDPKQPVKLKDIDPNHELKEGEHVLVAFPSRPTHESVKPVGKAAPVAVVPFFIGKKGEITWKPTDPTLVYSRPKGANNGPPPAEGILVDYYLVNAELGDGKFAVRATLKGPGAEEGKTITTKSWKPLRVVHPRGGAYSLHLELLDKDGKVVPGPMNDVTREFTVDPAAPAEAHAHPAPAPAASAAPATSAAPPKVGPKKK